jgi:hypothetical protein
MLTEILTCIRATLVSGKICLKRGNSRKVEGLVLKEVASDEDTKEDGNEDVSVVVS